MAHPQHHPLPIRVAWLLPCALATLTTGCELMLFAPEESEPVVVCNDALEPVSKTHAELLAPIRAVVDGARPKQLAAAQLELTLSQPLSERLTGLTLVLTVHSGKAMRGQLLHLTLGARHLQSATLDGPLGNEAQFDLELERDVCGTPCLLSFTIASDAEDANAPPSLDELDGGVGVPLNVEGELHAYVPRQKGCTGLDGWDIQVEVDRAQ